jgi:farnesyl diphosphate synthase
MAGGQAIDLASGPDAEPARAGIHAHAENRCADSRGGAAGCDGRPALSAKQTEQLDIFAKRIGLAFQVVDDVLDCEADTATLGKTAGKDAANDKPTYVSLMGLAEAKQFARDLREQAFAALEDFGPAADRLKQLADYIVARSF